MGIPGHLTCLFFFFNFIFKLYIIVLVLPNIRMNPPQVYMCLLRNIYASQEATVRTGHGTTDWFQVGKGVHQGCILSPCLFNLYAQYIMRDAGLEEAHAGIKITRRNINNLRCQEPARGTPLVAKVMKKEAQHTQRRDRASGVPLDIIEHLPPKNQSLPTLLLCALTSDFTGGCPPPPSRSL